MMRRLKYAFTLVLAASCPGADTCVTPESIWNMRSISDPQIHPAGRSIVYVEEWNDPIDDASYGNLQEVSSDGKTRRALTEGKSRNVNPRWSRDGSKLAYISSRGGAAKIRVRVNGTGEDKEIFEGGQPISNLVWSPDGRWLAFLMFAPGQPDWAPAMPPKPQGARWAPAPVAVTQLRWTFDGLGVLKPGANRIFVVPASGGAARAITPDAYYHTSYLYEPELTWSGDSKFVIAPAVRGKDGWSDYSGGEIYAFPVADGIPRPLTNRRGHEALVRVSPDGSSIAFVGYEWKNQTYHIAKLHVMASDGSNLRVLTNDWDRDVASPVWSADSKRIYFLSDDRGSTNLHVAGIDAGRRQLTRGSRRLANLSVSDGGAVAAIHSSPTEPGVLVSFPADSSERERRLVDLNAGTLPGCNFSPAEEIWFRSFDNREIQGWILKPPHFSAAKKYPLLVSIHGGPHGMYGNNFNQELQMHAARGYVVFYSNPRGSTGYGEEFGNVIQHKWPGDDIKDILAGVDHLVKAGYVDQSRMAVMGGSGGGLMTAWIIGQTDRFRAAVSLYPVTNWFTHVGSGDNGFYIASVYRKGMPWDEPEDYIRHSPLFFANNFKTPTIIITGEEDWRTPIAQSQELFRALKVRGVDSVFVRVPGEGHGIRKFPSHRVAVLVHTMAWLDKYIQRD